MFQLYFFRKFISTIKVKDFIMSETSCLTTVDESQCKYVKQYM